MTDSEGMVTNGNGSEKTELPVREEHNSGHADPTRRESINQDSTSPPPSTVGLDSSSGRGPKKRRKVNHGEH